MAEEKIKTYTDAQEIITNGWKLKYASQLWHTTNTCHSTTSSQPSLSLALLCRCALFIFKTITMQTHTHTYILWLFLINYILINGSSKLKMCVATVKGSCHRRTHIFESAPKTSSATVAKCGRGWKEREVTLVYPQDTAAAAAPTTCSMSTHAIAVWIFFYWESWTENLLIHTHTHTQTYLDAARVCVYQNTHTHTHHNKSKSHKTLHKSQLKRHKIMSVQ